MYKLHSRGLVNNANGSLSWNLSGMKNICSLSDMSDTKADNDTDDDMILESEMAPYDDMTLCFTDHATDPSRASLLDWAECLIELTVSTEGVTSDNHIQNPCQATLNQEAIDVKFDGNVTVSAKTLNTSTLSSGSDTQNTNHFQEMHLQDCLTLINADSNTNCLKNLSPSTSLNFLPSSISSNTRGHDSNVSTGRDVMSATTSEDTTCSNKSSLIPSSIHVHLNSNNLSESSHQHSTPGPETQNFSVQSSDKYPLYSEEQLTSDRLTVECSDQFMLQLSDSFFNVDVDMDTTESNIQSVVTTSSNSTCNHSLNTPVCEKYSPLKDNRSSRVAPSCIISERDHSLSLNLPNDSHTVSPMTPHNDMSKRVSNNNLNILALATHSSTLKSSLGVSSSCVTTGHVQSVCLDTSNDSRTISIESPENDIDLEKLVSCEEDTPSTHPITLDNQINQSYFPICFSETSPIFQERDIPFSWTEDTVEGITVQISSEPEESSFNPSFQVFQFKPCLGTSLPETDKPSLQNVDTDITTSNYEFVEIHSDFWNNRPETNTSREDLSKQKTSHDWGRDFVFTSQDGSDQETRSCNITPSNQQASEDLIIDNLSDLHNYCIDFNSEKIVQHVHESRKVTVSSNAVILNSVPKLDNSYSKVTSNSRFSNKQCPREAPPERDNGIPKEATDTIPFKNDILPEISVSKHIIHPKHRTKKRNKTLIGNNKTLTRHTKTWLKPSGSLEQYILTWPQNTETQDESQHNKSTDTSLQVTSASEPTLYDQQLHFVTPYLSGRHCDVSSDTILSSGDVFTSVLPADNLRPREKLQRNTIQTGTSADITDVSLESFDLSTFLSASSASYTDGEGSQEPLSGDALKDTLRSRLKAKARINVTSPKTIELHKKETSSKSGLDASLSSSSCCSSTSSVTGNGSDGKCNSRLMAFSRESSDDFSASNISQDGASDDDDMKEEDDYVSTPSPQTTRRWKKDVDTNKGNEGKQLAQRERNRLAAQKCRKRKIDRVDMLTQQVQRLELKQEQIRSEVSKLEFEKEDLQEMLRLHSFFCTKDINNK